MGMMKRMEFFGDDEEGEDGDGGGLNMTMVNLLRLLVWSIISFLYVQILE